MKKLLCLALVTAALATSLFTARAVQAEEVKPLKVLLICGGCCHDYAKQKDILKKGLEERAHVEVTILYTKDSSTRARFKELGEKDWAKGYDVVIHDECSADVKDEAYVQNILTAHRDGVPAVNLHCAMHCYRTGKPDWFEYLGLQSSHHGPQKPIAVSYVDHEHPIAQKMEDWTTINEELYNNVKVFDSAHALARGKQDTGKSVEDNVVAWTNQYGKARVFCTTLGHNNETVADPRYLDLVTRGLLWSCDKLNDQYLKPAPAPQAQEAGPEPTPAKKKK